MATKKKQPPKATYKDSKLTPRVGDIVRNIDTGDVGTVTLGGDNSVSIAVQVTAPRPKNQVLRRALYASDNVLLSGGLVISIRTDWLAAEQLALVYRKPAPKKVKKRKTTSMWARRAQRATGNKAAHSSF